MTKLADSPVAVAPDALAGMADMNAAGSMLLIPSMFTNAIYRFTPDLSPAAGE